MTPRFTPGAAVIGILTVALVPSRDAAGPSVGSREAPPGADVNGRSADRQDHQQREHSEPHPLIVTLVEVQVKVANQASFLSTIVVKPTRRNHIGYNLAAKQPRSSKDLNDGCNIRATAQL